MGERYGKPATRILTEKARKAEMLYHLRMQILSAREQLQQAQQSVEDLRQSGNQPDRANRTLNAIQRSSLDVRQIAALTLSPIAIEEIRAAFLPPAEAELQETIAESGQEALEECWGVLHYLRILREFLKEIDHSDQLLRLLPKRGSARELETLWFMLNGCYDAQWIIPPDWKERIQMEIVRLLQVFDAERDSYETMGIHRAPPEN